MIRKCERCGNPMDLFACEPRLGTLPELRSYRCPGCGHVETDAGTVGPLQRGDMQGSGITVRDAASARARALT
jgi:DNA-directed RNA polymerase subunit RPC12/RpoP